MAFIALGAVGCGDPPAQPPSFGGEDVVLDALLADTAVSDLLPVVDLAQDSQAQIDAAAVPDVIVADLDVMPSDAAEDVPDATSDIPQAAPACTTNADCPVSSKPCAVAKCSLATKTCLEFWQDPATACDDGDPCTEKTTCQCSDASCGDIQCKGGIDSCGCKSNADCSKLDDGDLCNGTWFCDVSADPSVCKPNPATVVKCPPLFDDPCNVAICNPLTGLNAAGLCDVTPTADGTACDDGKLCTVGDKCVGGKCNEGVGTCECQQNSDCKDDGNLCNGIQYCDKAQFPFKCKINPGSVVTCSKGDDSVCGTNTCDPKTGGCALLAMPDGGKCDDNNYCTVGDHCDKGKCAAGENTCGCLKDGDCSKFEAKNKCLGKVFCNLQLVEPACEINPATVVKCADVYDTQCAQNTCDPALGKCAMKTVKDAQPCDDGNVCTPDETCQSGVCISKTNNCACNTNSDCDSKDDGNKCNGLPYCNKAKVPYVCESNPATVVVCASVNDTACSKNVCKPLTGKCEMAASGDGLACDSDSNACTAGDACKAGACVAGTNKCECQKDSDCSGFEDGDVCNGTLFCDKAAGKCVVNPNTVVACKTANDTECLHNICKSQTGVCSMVAQKQGQGCNADDNPCTTGDTCDQGKCIAGENTCSCTANDDCGKYDGANLCIGKMFCNKAKPPFKCEINPATVVSCGAGNPPMCQKYACVPATGVCSNGASAGDIACDDGKLCTIGDVCKDGGCVPGVNICGCFSNGDCAAQEDGNYCNGTLYCDKSALPFLCKVNPATVVVCSAANDQGCLKNQCDAASGQCTLAAALENDPCLDGDACTLNEHCKGGACLGVAIACNDGNLCTVDACDPLDGCLAIANGVAACDDGDACTADSCDVKTGCGHKALDSGPCDDGDACSTADSCSAGKCKGKVGGCDDGNPCTDDSCALGGKSCLHKANVAPCGDGKVCLDGLCGGCEAFRRVHRYNCDEIVPLVAQAADGCKEPNNFDREEYEGVAVLSDGAAVAVGGASVDKTNKTAGYVSKFNAGGKLVWDKIFGALGDRLLGVAAAGGGELVAAGAASANGLQRPWLLRVAGDGKAIFSVQLPADSTQVLATKGQFEDVAMLIDGSIIAVGSQQAASANNAAIVARFDASGGLLWQKVFLGSGIQAATLSQRLIGVRQTRDAQGVIVVGDSNNPKAPEQALDGLVMRLDLNGNLVWSKNFGGKLSDGFSGVDLTNDGAVVAVGVTNKISASLPGDGWILRLDAKGNKLTEEVVATVDHEEFRGVACAADGACTAVGFAEVDHGGDPTFSKTYDKGHAWVVRWDTAGKITWNQRFDALGLEKLYSATIAPNGDVIAAGDTRAVDKLDKADGLLLRIDSKGKDLCDCRMFKTAADTPGESRLFSTIALNDDSVIAVGWMTQADGSSDALLGRWDRYGKAVWQKNLGGAANEQLRHLVRDEKGNFRAVGSSSSGVGKLDGWLVRFDEDGKILEQLSFGGSENDDFRWISPIPVKLGGGWIVAGGTASGSVGKTDGWLLRLADAGNVVWSKTVGTSLEERFNCVGITGSGGVLVGGESAAAKDNPTKYAWPWISKLDLNGVVTGEDFYTGYPTGCGVFGAVPTSDGGVALTGRMVTAAGTIGVLVYGVDGVLQSKVAGDSGFFNGWLAGSSDGILALPGKHHVAYGWGNDGGHPLTQRFDDKWSTVWSSPGGAKTAKNTEYAGGALTADGTAIFVGHSKVGGIDKGVLMREHLAKSNTLADPTCNPKAPCATGGCDSYTGCVGTNAVTTCTDGNYCTAGDTCNGGICSETKVTVCDDGNPCTTEKCAIGGGCYAAPAQTGVACAADKVCDASGNCGSCAYIRKPLDFENAYKPALASLDMAGGKFAIAGKNQNDANAYVNAFDNSGNKLWGFKSDIANKADQLQALATVADGGLIAAGKVDNYYSNTYDDLLMLRLDKDGKLLWQQIYVAADGQEVQRVTVADGAVYFAGSDWFKSMWGEVDLATGKMLWQISGNIDYAGSYDAWQDVAKLPDGGWILTGYYSTGKAVVQRLDAAKKIVWSYKPDLPVDHKFLRTLIGNDGTLTAIGVAHTTGDGPWVVRLNMADGKLIWQYRPSTVFFQVPTNGALVADGSVLLTGSVDVPIYAAAVGWVERVDTNGTFLWQRLSNLDSYSAVLGLAADPTGTWTALGSANYANVLTGYMQRFSVDGTFQCKP